MMMKQMIQLHFIYIINQRI